jgi:hypothetical protein
MKIHNKRMLCASICLTLRIPACGFILIIKSVVCPIQFGIFIEDRRRSYKKWKTRRSKITCSWMIKGTFTALSFGIFLLREIIEDLFVIWGACCKYHRITRNILRISRTYFAVVPVDGQLSNGILLELCRDWMSNTKEVNTLLTMCCQSRIWDDVLCLLVVEFFSSSFVILIFPPLLRQVTTTKRWWWWPLLQRYLLSPYRIKQ